MNTKTVTEKAKRVILLLLLFTTISSCDYLKGEKNGTYCANVQYYYPKTDTKSNYTLKVEIDKNQLKKIFWPNGGWLDNTHFSSPTIVNDFVEFQSDNGVTYKVSGFVDSNNCENLISNNSMSESDFINQERQKICSKCGNFKNPNEEYCKKCLRKMSEIYIIGNVDYYKKGIVSIGNEVLVDQNIGNGNKCTEMFTIYKDELDVFESEFTTFTLTNTDYEYKPNSIRVEVFKTISDATKYRKTFCKETIDKFRFNFTSSKYLY